MTDRGLRVFSVGLVVALGIPAMLELEFLPSGSRFVPALLLAIGGVSGVYAALRRNHFAARTATALYGIVMLGLGLFVTGRAAPDLLAYVVGLLALNVLLYHVRAYGPVLSTVAEEDATSRRSRAVAMRSLGLSGAVLVLSFGGSLALLPVVALDVRLPDPLLSLGIAVGLLLVLLVLALFPDAPRLRRLG